MSVAVYEFPLCEKVRNYLRLEQAFIQLLQSKHFTEDWQYMNFFDCLFSLVDLIERLDLRTEFLRDIDVNEKNLVFWSQHPNIDSSALETALKNLHRIIATLKKSKKLGSRLKDDRFLSSLRQRFSIPGGASSFDLPHLYYWFKQPDAVKQQDIQRWLVELAIVKECVALLMNFLRERGRFSTVVGNNGFYQGTVESKTELIRIRCRVDDGYYPILSGNKYRYSIKFTYFNADESSSGAVEGPVEFEQAAC